MKCIHIEDKIVDYIEVNLSEQEIELITNHIRTCESCKNTLEQTKEMLNKFNLIPDFELSEDLNKNLDEMLESEEKLALRNGIVSLGNNKVWGNVFKIAASIFFLMFGYVARGYIERDAQQNIAVNENQQRNKKLMLGMMENNSPSERIKGVGYFEDFRNPDIKIIEALVDRMKNDSNSNVRFAAVEALSTFSESELIKSSLIDVLNLEPNPSIQIEIIKILVSSKDKRALAPMKILLGKANTTKYVKDRINIAVSALL